MNRETRIQILQVPGCPFVDRLIDEVERCLTEAAVAEPVEIIVGDYPSPTLVVDGLDVATGRPVAGEPRCRMDLPSPQQIRVAIGHLMPDDAAALGSGPRHGLDEPGKGIGDGRRLVLLERVLPRQTRDLVESACTSCGFAVGPDLQRRVAVVGTAAGSAIPCIRLSCRKTGFVKVLR